jgi:hypothetical protein
MGDPIQGASWTYSAPEHDPEESRRRSALLRRLRVLLYAGTVAFALTTWMLVRVDNPAALLGWCPGPSTIARAHLQALNRGELRVAYEMFSAQYRQQVPFEAYHQLVVTHRSMFLIADATFQETEDSGNRAVLDSSITTSEGEHYRARFTMVRIDGRWWIDDLRWGLAAEDTLIKT